MGPGGSAVHFCSPFSLQSTTACLWMVNLQYNASARFPQVHTGSFRFTQVHTGSFRSGLLGIRTLLGRRITLSIGRAGVICATGVHTADIPTENVSTPKKQDGCHQIGSCDSFHCLLHRKETVHGVSYNAVGHSRRPETKSTIDHPRSLESSSLEDLQRAQCQLTPRLIFTVTATGQSGVQSHIRRGGGGGEGGLGGGGGGSRGGYPPSSYGVLPF